MLLAISHSSFLIFKKSTDIRHQQNLKNSPSEMILFCGNIAFEPEAFAQKQITLFSSFPQ